MGVTKLQGSGHSGRPTNTRKKVSVSLPTKLSVPPSSPEGYTYFIYGEQKIGKTSFTTQFPKCLHIMFEPSGRDYEIFQVAPESWEEFLAYIDEIEKAKKEGSLEFKTFALDTIDLCYEMCSEKVCKDAGVKHLSEGEWGSLYQKAELEFRKAIERLARCGGFIALSHNKEKEVTLRSGKKFERVEPSAAKKANLTLAKFCDLTGHYHVSDDGAHVLHIGKSPDIESGNRMKSRFNYTDGTPMDYIPMGSDEVEAYANFTKAFNNKFEKPKPTKVEATSNPAPQGAKPGLRLKKSK